MKKFKLLYCFVMFFFFVSVCSGAVDFTNSLIKCIKTENIEEAKNIIRQISKIEFNSNLVDFDKIDREYKRIKNTTEKQKKIIKLCNDLECLLKYCVPTCNLKLYSKILLEDSVNDEDIKNLDLEKISLEGTPLDYALSLEQTPRRKVIVMKLKQAGAKTEKELNTERAEKERIEREKAEKERIAKELAEKQAKLAYRNSKEYKTKYPLHSAVRSKSFKQIRQIIKDGELNLNKFDNEGLTALDIANQIEDKSDKFEICNILKSAGAATSQEIADADNVKVTVSVGITYKLGGYTPSVNCPVALVKVEELKLNMLQNVLHDGNFHLDLFIVWWNYVMQHCECCATTNETGKVDFSSVKPGKYLVLSESRTRSGSERWIYPIICKEKETKIVLSEQNCLGYIDKKIVGLIYIWSQN